MEADCDVMLQDINIDHDESEGNNMHWDSLDFETIEVR